jgi:hypothetical protein
MRNLHGPVNAFATVEFEQFLVRVRFLCPGDTRHAAFEVAISDLGHRVSFDIKKLGTCAYSFGDSSLS